MNYSIRAKSSAKNDALIKIKETTVVFGTTGETDELPNPAELFLSSLAACILKNVERFSNFMNFEYVHADVQVDAIRLEKPPRMNEIHYDLTIYTNDDRLNIALLKKNIEKFGTIFNTIKASCTITGEIKKRPIDK